MVPDLLAGYTFLSSVTAKDGDLTLPGMIGKTVERMTGLAISGADSNGDGFPDRVQVRWTGGPTIARGLGEYMGNLLGNPDFWIATTLAILPGFIRGYSPIEAPSKLGSVINLMEEAGTKSMIAAVAGTIFDPPPNLDMNTYAPADNPRGPLRGLGTVKQMSYHSQGRPHSRGGSRYGSIGYREAMDPVRMNYR